MSGPTILSPWYIVVRPSVRTETEGMFLFYTSQDESAENVWSSDRKKSMLFNSLRSAHRVARAEGAYVVVVVDETDLKEYR